MVGVMLSRDFLGAWPGPSPTRLLAGGPLLSAALTHVPFRLPWTRTRRVEGLAHPGPHLEGGLFSE